jgi:dimethylamine/trimethylamine dehydrogenase
MGEEWRRNWHPERVPPGDPEKSTLIVGAGPAGLECARVLGLRGFAVTVAEAREELGGRVTIEAKLPGLATWARVRDYRTNLVQTMGNVDIYRGSPLSAQDVIDFGCDHAVIATGAHWTREILSTNGTPCLYTGRRAGRRGIGWPRGHL